MSPDLQQTGWIAGALTVASTLFSLLEKQLGKGRSNAFEKRVAKLETDGINRTRHLRVLLREAHRHSWDLSFKADDEI